VVKVVRMVEVLICSGVVWSGRAVFCLARIPKTKNFHGPFHHYVHFHHKFHPICYMEWEIIISDLRFDKGFSRRWETVNIRRGRCVSAKLITYCVLKCQHNCHQRSKSLPNTWKSWLVGVKVFLVMTFWIKSLIKILRFLCFEKRVLALFVLTYVTKGNFPRQSQVLSPFALFLHSLYFFLA